MSSSAKLIVSGIICFLAVVGCAKKPEEQMTGNCDNSDDAYAIVGGRVLNPDSELSLSTVYLDSSIGGCTATIIAPNVVLTAAHCLIKAKSLRILFTNNVLCSKATQKITSRNVTKVLIHERYLGAQDSSDEIANDLAIMKFDGELPSGYKVRELPSKDYKMSEASSFVLSGYGLTEENNDDGNRILRFARVPSTSLTSRSWREPHKIISIEIPKIGTCPGDSGGPLFSDDGNGNITLLGVASRGSCKGWSIYTSVQAHVNWLQEKIISLNQ